MSQTKSKHINFDARDYNSKYLKQIHGLIGAIEDKQAYSKLRHDIISRQDGKHYQLEYDRINGILQGSILSQVHPNYDRLKNRAKELEALGAMGFNR